MKSRRFAAAVAVVALLAAGCSNKHVTRIEPETVTDLSGRWNDTDSRLVANALIEQSLTDPWLSRYSTANGGYSPAVIVGEFRNRSTEHIPVNTFVNDLENAYINSGAVTVVAGDAQRAVRLQPGRVPLSQVRLLLYGEGDFTPLPLR